MRNDREDVVVVEERRCLASCILRVQAMLSTSVNAPCPGRQLVSLTAFLRLVQVGSISARKAYYVLCAAQ